MNAPATATTDLNLFRVFHEVYRARGLTLAGRRLGLSQPAVSNALARLRAQVGDPLFVRAGRRIVPTPRANEMAPHVDAALAALDAALQVEQGFLPEQAERRFTVGMRELIEIVLLPKLARTLAREAPKMQLQSARIERRLLPRLLASQTLDLAVDVQLPAAPGVQQRQLFEEELCVALRKGHPAARGALTTARYLSLRHVTVSARATGPVLEDVLARERLTRDVAVRCQHYHAACQLVAESDLALTLPRRYAERMRPMLDLRVIKAPPQLPTLAVMVYWHESAERDPGLVWLRDRIIALAATR